LPSSVLKIKEHCSEHQEKFNLHCKEHECPCCRICIVKNHSDCKDVAIIEEIIKNVKTSFTCFVGYLYFCFIQFRHQIFL
jgi:predicted transcriptional regulator